MTSQYCTQCGNAVDPTENFCTHCGTEIEEDASRPAIPLLIAVGGVLLAVIAVAVVLVTGGIQPQEAGAPSDGESAEDIPFPMIERITVADAFALVEDGDAVLVDVRDASAFQRAHAEGALSIPEDDLNERMNEIPRDQLIITYCT